MALAATTTAEKLWKRVRVSRWADFQTEIEKFLDGNYLFRGVTSVRFPLIPSVGRRREGYGYSQGLEKSLFDQFKREALPFLSNRPHNNWEWLVLAQHHGVPTRLLDWSESPSVSLFFAVWGNDDDDAGLYIIPRPNEVPVLEADPLEVTDVHFFYPGYVAPRLVSQRGLFTVHPNPEAPYLPDGMQQIVIGKEAKADFRRKLDATGTHHAVIFADLDGLSRRLIALQGYRMAGATIPTDSAPSGPAIDRAKAMARHRTGASTETATRKINPRDPQKGQWGEQSVRNGWIVTARVTQIVPDWFRIILAVAAEPNAGKVLTGRVTFHLHDTFTQPVVTVEASGGIAEYPCSAYGAFTVGILIESDGTPLEIDLADLESAPKEFRER